MECTEAFQWKLLFARRVRVGFDNPFESLKSWSAGYGGKMGGGWAGDCGCVEGGCVVGGCCVDRNWVAVDKYNVHVDCVVSCKTFVWRVCQ